jgi:hypothetical protein
MADNVIKEFLISLGVETNGVDKFDDQIDMATAKAVAFGEAMYDAAKAVAEAVAGMVTGFSNLYWQSKNVGSSAGDIKAAGFAWTQLGGSVASANAAMQSLANFNLTYGNGARGFLTQLGVSPKDIGDSAATLHDLEGIFQRMVAHGGANGLTHANAIAGFLGISSDQLRVMLRDGGQYEAQYAAIAKEMGVNLEDASKASNDLMIRIGFLQAQFELWADNEGIKIVKGAIPYFQEFSDKINEIAASKDGLQEWGDVAIAVMTAVAARAVIANASFLPFVAALSVLMKYENRDDKQKADAWGESGIFFSDLMHGNFSGAGKVFAKGYHEDMDPFLGNAPAAATSNGSDGKSPHASTNAKYVFDYFKGIGAGDVQAKGVAAMLYSENTKFDPNATNEKGAHGLAQWLSKDRLAEFQRIFGHSLENSTMDEQLEFVARELHGKYRGVWEQMKRATSAIDVAKIGIHGYEAPGPGESGDVGRASNFLGVSPRRSGGVTLNQTTTIHASGANSNEIGTDVAGHQDSVNQRMVATASVYQW